jgi:3',5'-cyclic AMP phosphodiesterase CpdA
VSIQTLAHISDLHLGRSDETDRVAEAIRDLLVGGEVDHVVCTGDVTHRGRRSELARFNRLFGGLIASGRMTVVPGNHDRLGDDVAGALMQGGRVEVAQRDGLYLVRVDSTGSHNRWLLTGHGDLDHDVIEQIDLALDGAPANTLVAILLHHHPLPLPEETLSERISTRIGWPAALELRLGRALIEKVRGRCDLLLHGHRHVPRALSLWTEGERAIGIYNAGCTTSLARFRLFCHTDGALVGAPRWLRSDGAAAADLIAEAS